MPASTVHAVLIRCRINRLSAIDRVTGEPLRRYEHPHPGSLIHVDVTKFGNIPDGGGHKFVGRQQSKHNSVQTAHRTGKRGDRAERTGVPRIGTAFVHTVIDDHSRVAYAEICTDEKGATAIGVLQRAVAWFADRGVMLSECCPTTARPTGPTPGATPAPNYGSPPNGLVPYRPQTNGKIERFHRTLADGWAYARLYESKPNARLALPGWLHLYNHHRAHSAIGGQPPVTRLTNLPGHHN